MHPNIEGKPDILIKDSDTLLFLDGCFWHKCPKCYSEPATNRDFWAPKIEKNVKNDKKTTLALKKQGWRVLRIWEHEIKNDILGCLDKMLK